jgi:hypothetical protein
MLSSATFLSDLGGKNYHGSNDPTDIDFKDIRYAFGGGIQYNTGKTFGISLNAFYTRLSADDNETEWDKRQGRNLSVRTDLVEASLMMEFTIPNDIPVLRGLYFNAGIGANYFKPQAEYQGVYYDLRILGTEGQVADPLLEPYGLFSPVIPFGFGKKFNLANGMRLCLDVSLRKTFTDYLDDVSTVYYDNSLILASSGQVAAALADPSDQNDPFNEFGITGRERGDPTNKDNYFLFGFRLEIPLGAGGYGNYNTSCSFSQSWIRSDGSIPKIRRRGRARRRLFR